MIGLSNHSKKLVLRVLWLIFLLLIDSNWLFNVGNLLCILLWKLSCCFLLGQFWLFILVAVVVQGRLQRNPQLTSILIKQVLAEYSQRYGSQGLKSEISTDFTLEHWNRIYWFHCIWQISQNFLQAVKLFGEQLVPNSKAVTDHVICINYRNYM